MEGNLQALEGQKEIRIEFSYESMIVGEESEITYVEKMKDRWNGEAAGKGRAFSYLHGLGRVRR